MNTETCGTGRSSGCPPVPCGLWAVPGGSAPLPLPRVDDRDRDRLQGSCWAPTAPRAGDLQPRALTRGHGCLSSPGRGPLRPWLCGVWCSQLVWVGRWLGTHRAHSTMSLAPSRPQRLVLPVRAAQPARHPRKRACVHVYVPALSVVVSPGKAGSTRGEPLSLPRGWGSRDALVGSGQV